MIRDVTPDWIRLEDLAQRTGFKPEEVTAMRRRWHSDNRAERRVLLIGRRTAGIELVLARGISAKAADAFAKSKNHNLLLAKRPKASSDRRKDMPFCKWSASPADEILVFAGDDDLPARIADDLGDIDLAVFVTRLGQPFHQNERKLARRIADLVPAVNGLIVGLPGEEASADQLAEVAAFSTAQLQAAGFTDARCLGSHVWYVDGKPRDGAARKISDPFNATHRELDFSRRQMGRRMLVQLVDRGVEQAREQNGQSACVISDDDHARRAKELAHYLKQLGRELASTVRRRPQTEQAILRQEAADAFRSWSAPTTVEGIWLRYCEQIRPGFRNDFLAEVSETIEFLEYEPRQAQPSSRSWSQIVPAIRNNLVCGLVAAGAALVGGLLLPSGWPWFRMSVVAMAAIGGFAIATRIRQSVSPHPAVSSVLDDAESSLRGWLRIERRLLAWFAEKFSPGQRSLVAEWHELQSQIAVAE